MALRLITYPNNPRAFKALIAAQFNGTKIEVPAFEMGKDNRTPEFLAGNPTGKVPTLLTPQGAVFESNAIARYVARLGEKKHNLYGASALEAGQVESWLDFATNEIELPALAYLMPLLGYMEKNAKVEAKALEDISKALNILNNHLLYRTFLVGNRITLADIVIACNVYSLYTRGLDAKARKPYGNVNRWFDTLIHQPQFAAVMGDVTLFGETPKKADNKKADNKKADNKKAEKKEEKPAAAAAEEPKKEKPKNPLDLLPPSKFVVDDWKRTYSNARNTRTICPTFWETFDREGWSIWFADYKYNDELEKLFMTCNLIGGWMQRLDAIRKYAFGNVLICGEENKHKITACWVFRGSEIPQGMKDNDDSLLYDWKKANLDDAETRALIDDFMCWEGPKLTAKFGECLDGKTFK